MKQFKLNFKSIVQSKARWLLTLIAILTLGVGQMWADDKGFYEVYMVYDKNGTEYNYTYNGSNGSMDLGTITSSFKIKKMYLKVWDSWGDQAFEAGSSGLGYKTQSGSDTDYKTNNRTSKSGNNYELQHTNMNLTIASNTNPSGNYTFTHWWFADGTWTDTYYLKNSSSNCAFTYEILPPAVKSSSVTISATNTAAGSGTGLSSGSPIILISGMGSTLTVSATQNHTDANSALWCKFGGNSYSSTTTYDIASGTETTNQTLALKVKYRNNSASLDGAETTTTIYYKWAAPAPAISLTSVSPATSIVAGNDITLVGTRANSSNTISFQYTTNDGSTWTDITPKTSSLSSNTLTATWTIPDAHGATQTFKFRAKLAEATPIYSSKSSGVSVYNTKTIKVKNTNNWGTFYSYVYNSESDKREAWHGSATGITSAGGQWKNVVLTSQYAYFILNDNGSNQIKGDNTYTYSSSVTDGNCYAISSGTGTNLTFSSATCPSAPTSVTTSEDAPTSVTNAKMTIHGNIGGNGNDNITDYGFYYGTTSSPGTKAQVGTSNTTGAISKQLTGLTAGTTYYYKTYATNGQGTSYGDVESYKLPYKVTVTQPTGCSAITNSGTNYTNSTIEVTATKATGYTFSSWSTTNGTITSTSSTSTTNTIVFTPTSDNATIAPVYTENMTTVTLTASPAGKGTFTIGGAAATSTTAGVATTRSVTAVAGTGYRVNTSATVWARSNENITLSSTTTNPVTVTGAGSVSTSTLTATFTPNNYTITLNKHNGESNQNISVTYDANTNLTSGVTPPTRSGYTFDGYYTSEGGSGTQLVEDDGDWITNNAYISSTGTWVNAGNVTLHAKWTANHYDITLDNQGGSDVTVGTECVLATKNVLDITYGTPYFACYLSSSATVKTGYSLGGWYSGVGGTGDQIFNEYGSLQSSTVYTDGDGNWTNAGDVTVYAKWTMTISGAGCIHADKIAYTAGGMTMTYNSSTITSFTPASKTGYILQGYWNADSDGDKIINADGTFVGEDVTDWVEDGKWVYEGTTPTICAHFEPITYHIAFDPDNIARYVNDATGSMETIDATYDEYVTLPANTFTRTDYNFLGWAKGSDSTTYTWMDKSSAVINLARTDDATVTLYAFWQGVSVTVSFNKGAGYSVYPTSTTLHVGETYGQGTSLSEGELPTPSAPAGYVFAGWYTSASGGTLVTKNTQLTVSGDHTLYAHYTKADRVYFKNTLGWDKVYVTWDAEWNRSSQDKGAGSYGKTQELMTNIYGTDIWYKDIPAAILSDWAYNIAFTEKSMSNYEWFDEGQAVFRRDFDKNTTLFVPMKTDPNTFLKNKHDSKTGTTYYSTKEKTDGDGKYKNGYWMKYEDLQAGYSLKGSWNWVAEHFIERSTTSDSVYSYTMKGLSANTTYYYKLYKLCSNNTTGSVFSTSTSITSATAADAAILNAEVGDDNASFTTTVAGDYTFKFNLSKTGVIKLTIEYPFKANDYRVVYGWNDGSAHTFASEIIKKSASTNDTISMFIHKVESPVVSRSLTIQKCTAINGSGVPTWTAGNTIDLSSITKSGVYNFVIEQPASGEPTGSFWKKYDGNFYIRMDSVEGGWDQYKYHPENIMTYSEYSLTQTLSAPYSHYYCKYVGNSSTDISYTVATDYSPMICPVLEGDATIGVGNKTLYSGKPASVRFTYNEETNGTFRSYLKSAQGAGNTRFLVMHGTDNKLRDKDGNEIAANVGASLAANELLFSDTENWVYEVSIQAKPGAQVSIIAQYNDVDRYLVGSSSSWETILGGSGDNAYLMKAVYDFKTNRLITAWTPTGTVTETLSDAQVLIERHNQDGATVITFGKASVDAEAGSISAKRVIGALRFDYSELVGRVSTWNETTRAKMMFFVSFPFDVNVSDIFGLNSNYGEAYIVQKYDGAERAAKGFFLGDGTETFWKILPVDSVMHAGQGYVVTMDNDYLNGDVGHVWDNKRSGDHVYLYFPSANTSNITINSDAKTIKVPAHKCNINKTFSGGKLNHKYTDSNWNLMGVPIFQNHTGNAESGTPGAIFTPTEVPTDTTAYIDHPDLGYFYEWSTSKTYTIRSAVGFVFKPMHCYMVQYTGNVKFTCATPAVVAAPRRTLKDENYNIELQVLNNDEEMLDHTYVELRENAVDSFALNEDTYMMQSNKAVSVYTFAGTYDVAANVLSIGSHVVPVGVIVNRAGTYTFSMPSNFSGTVT